MASPVPTPEFPMRRTCPFSAPAEYRELRDTQPVAQVNLWDGRSAWLLTRYDDIRSILRSSSISSQTRRPNFPFLSASDQAAKMQDESLQRMDGPEHSRRRRLLIPFFTVHRIEALRPTVTKLVRELLENLVTKTPPVDFFTEFSLVVPSTVACELLGVPYQDHEFFQEKSAIRISRTATPTEITEATDELLDYLGGLLDARSVDPRDDVMTFLADHVTNGDLTREDALMDANLLLLGGHETTANVITLGTMALLENPDQLARITSGEVTVTNAIEELLRVTSVTHSNAMRLALEDIEVGGRTIPAGDGFIAAVSAANWDESIFPNPEVLDVGRPEARQHMAFGYGVHQCLGQALARMELEVVIEAVFDVIPSLRSAQPIEQLRFKDDSAFYGVHEFPVTW
ncbi:Cytochrome P450 [Rhodococcus koreensis]|uniref:Cytochrome P450 n=1 Tax=Rhodococcus koreensis TaxID=99653 RepID=A0A1H4ZMI1_9NOCA|nr:Cytochrome P450 [Rhodococcus koreensis]